MLGEKIPVFLQKLQKVHGVETAWEGYPSQSPSSTWASLGRAEAGDACRFAVGFRRVRSNDGRRASALSCDHLRRRLLRNEPR